MTSSAGTAGHARGRAYAAHQAGEHAAQAAVLAGTLAHFEAALAPAAHHHVVQRSPGSRDPLQNTLASSPCSGCGAKKGVRHDTMAVPFQEIGVVTPQRGS